MLCYYFKSKGSFPSKGDTFTKSKGGGWIITVADLWKFLDLA